MTAKLLMSQREIDQPGGRDRWHQARAGGITASEMPRVLGVGTGNKTAFSLYAEKVTGERDEGDTDELERGRVLEPYVAGKFPKIKPGHVLLPGGLYASADDPWLMATYDGLAAPASVIEMIPGFAFCGARHNGQAVLSRLLRDHPDAAASLAPVEIKTAHEGADSYEEWGEPGTADMPVQYKIQALTQMYVWGAGVVYVPVHFMLGWRTVLYVVERNEQTDSDWAWMRGEAQEFLERVYSRDPPPVDWSPMTTASLYTLHPFKGEDTSVTIPRKLAKRYKAAVIAKNKASERAGLLTNLVTERMAGAHRAVIEDDEHPGKFITVMTRSKPSVPDRVDLEYLRAHYPEAAADSTKPGKASSRAIPGKKWVSS